MKDNFFGITDTGRQRTNNEDTFIAQPVLNGQYIMACVIDGVGGYEGGEVAADITRNTVLHYFSIPSGEIPTMMQEAFSAANEKIEEEKKRNGQFQNMSCVVTLALADIQNKIFYYAHVGDTRLYLYRDETLIKITKDHSFVGFLEDNGRLSEDAAMSHPKRNEIDKALGFGNTQLRGGNYAESGQSPFLPGDLLLLCSDGLSDLVTSAEITAILQNNSTLQSKGNALINAANLKGGKDNITVVLVHNNSKAVKQKRTKPVLIKKNAPPQQKAVTPAEHQKQDVALKKDKPKSYKSAVIILTIACLALLAAVGYLLWPKFQQKEKETFPVATNLGEWEKKLHDSIHNMQGNRLNSGASNWPEQMIISDTLFVQKDSLYLNGGGRTVLVADSSYTGPALAFVNGAQTLFLDSITLQNFDIGVLANNAVVHLRGVRFINCRVPVLYQYGTMDSMAVSGVIKNQLFSTGDTLIKTSKQ